MIIFCIIPFLWFFIFRQAQGANSQAMSFGKSRAVPWKKQDKIKTITFKDVAGVDEAVEELREIVEFLNELDEVSISIWQYLLRLIFASAPIILLLLPPSNQYYGRQQ